MKTYTLGITPYYPDNLFRDELPKYRAFYEDSKGAFFTYKAKNLLEAVNKALAEYGFVAEKELTEDDVTPTYINPRPEYMWTYLVVCEFTGRIPDDLNDLDYSHPNIKHWFAYKLTDDAKRAALEEYRKKEAAE